MHGFEFGSVNCASRFVDKLLQIEKGKVRRRLVGALASFLAVGRGRQRLAGDRPEQFLRVWRMHAENQRSNPVLYIARHTEFMVRRCFFPYALCAFAVFNIMSVAFVLSVIGANLVWPISLYSSRTFGIPPTTVVVSPAASP